MPKLLYDKKMPSGVKTYATRANAIARAEALLAKTNHRYLIVATVDGRFMPVAIGMACMQDGVHFHMPVAA